MASGVPSFYTVSKFRGIKETHNCTPYAKWGVVIPESSIERNATEEILQKQGDKVLQCCPQKY